MRRSPNFARKRNLNERTSGIDGIGLDVACATATFSVDNQTSPPSLNLCSAVSARPEAMIFSSSSQNLRRFSLIDGTMHVLPCTFSRLSDISVCEVQVAGRSPGELALANFLQKLGSRLIRRESRHDAV
jgi:hypothetical protein